jgi:hypothetical protein
MIFIWTRMPYTMNDLINHRNAFSAVAYARHALGGAIGCVDGQGQNRYSRV